MKKTAARIQEVTIFDNKKKLDSHLKSGILMFKHRNDDGAFRSHQTMH